MLTGLNSVLIISLFFIVGIRATNAREPQTYDVTDDPGRWKRSTRPVTCQDKYAVIPGHTMCLADITTHPVTAADRQIIVDRHNAIRRSVSPPAADMLELQYFTSLGQEAQIWAEQCKMDHDHNYQRFQPGRFMVGQNIVINGKEMLWSDVIDVWQAEISKFHYGQAGHQRLDVGHYTQMIWAKTSLVGCGMAKCGTKFLYICNYGPSGNVGTVDKPYERSTSGQSCDMCPGHCNATSKLCDCNGKFCLNGGTLNLTTCQCQCNSKVTRYDPDVCELVCTDTPDNPLCGSFPWTQDQCPYNMAAVFNCPLLCQVCPYAGVNYTERDVTLQGGGAVIHHFRSTLLLCMVNMVFLFV